MKLYPKMLALKNQNLKIFPKYNVTSEERQSLNELKTRGNIIISNSDIGGAVVI